LKGEHSVANAIEGQSESVEQQKTGGASVAVPRPIERERKTAGGLFRVRKPGQGTHVRWGTAIGAGALALAGAHFVWEQMDVVSISEQYDFLIRTMVPVVLLVAALYGIFVLVGRNERVIEFMTATEGEMKKVNWSTRREVWGATKVVIVTVLALAFILAIVDLAFIVLFWALGVLRMPMSLLQTIFGGGES